MLRDVRKYTAYILNSFLILISLVSFLALSSATTHADESVIDDVAIGVPVSCTLSGTGMDTHNAEVPNGTYRSEIGTTTLKASCNDQNGFAIYAAGYTGEVIGGENSNKLVGSTAEIGDIITGTATSAGNPDVSNWAMKLTTNSGATYPITIDSAPNTSGGANAPFSAYHIVPNEYTKVAHRDSSTDVGQSATGATLTTTYAAYISKTQGAGTYAGKVIYTLVHPASHDAPIPTDQVEVVYDGNGLTFANGKTTNRVRYSLDCDSYVGSPTISKTQNIDDDGEMIEYNTSNENIEDTISFPGADYIKIELKYAFDPDGFLNIFYDGDSTDGKWYHDFWSESLTTTEIVIETDTVSFELYRNNEPSSGYYGYYAKVYPVYQTEQPNTSYEELPSEYCDVNTVFGEYAETNPWNGHWTYNETGNMYSEEDGIKHGLVRPSFEDIKGTTVKLYAYFPYKIAYYGNGSTSGTMGEQTIPDDVRDYVILLATNYDRSNYGFAGWSEDPNATVNSNYKIYGPNESVIRDELTYDDQRKAKLYAVWVQSNGDLQNWSGCSNLSKGEVTALRDQRDNQVYAVAKLADDKCWMIENLRLEAENSRGSNAQLAQGYESSSTYGNFIGLADAETNNITGSNGSAYTAATPPNSIYYAGTQEGTASIDIAQTSYAGWRIPRYNNMNTQSRTSDATSYTDRLFGYGNYYNWAAAIASTSPHSVGIVSNYSICPSGWRLPIGGRKYTSNSDYWDLIVNYLNGGVLPENYNNSYYPYYSGANEGGAMSRLIRSYPNNFVQAGTYRGGAVSRTNQQGFYLSSNPNQQDANIFGLTINNTAVYPGTHYIYRFYGMSVRCLTNP